MEESMAKGREWLDELLGLMGLNAKASIERVEQPDGTTADWLTIDTNNLSSETIELLIGDRGNHIDAIQFLANLTLNFGVADEEHRSYTIELNGYRKKRQAELYELVRDLVRQVRETGEEVEVKNLSSAERKQIHTFLDGVGDLTTESRGQEPDRRLAIKFRSAT
jgi:spoIIIJ-associated protein